MFLVDFFKKFFRSKGIARQEENEKPLYGQENLREEIHSIWDYLKLNENTQASHIIAVLGFDEWISMEEIMRRIRELFHVDYQNDRSLYPYIKTLVDVGLVETQSTGGKKKWRKRDTLIKLKTPPERETEEEIAKVAARKG
ncbi:Uncharacterised protein [uncultured archaeon]|nr:Uncharacterised protein [uncultured archaeon]